ncbi:hypothetical protein [Clostridium sp.]|jgi:hypothetical protein|uniref:hypothetical protein n=1 Tax=Clostridium sp. TaxID=1506 RepID=UPI003EF07012
MSHKNTPYPFDGMPDEDYFGELGTSSSTMENLVPKDNNPSNREIDHNDTIERKPKGAFSDFSIFPMD